MKDTGTFRDDTIIANRATGYQPALAIVGCATPPLMTKRFLPDRDRFIRRLRTFINGAG